jgi:rRNA-processing protein CGR1
MKKPPNLKLKDVVKKKRIHAISSDFKERKKGYDELKALRQELKKRKEEAIEKAKAERKRIERKKRQKEINMIKSGKYEIIQNPTKIKKWKRKARKLLQKLPPELFYEKSK